MTRIAPNLPVRGLADLEGRLVEADPALAELHARSGGAPGGEIVIPQLAALVRLVARLEVPAFRSVSAADEGADIDLAVHALPRDGHVRIEIGAWDSRPAPRGGAGHAGTAPQDAAPSAVKAPDMRPGVPISFAVDARLDLAAPLDLGGEAGRDAAGQPLTRLFALRDGGSLLLEAFARQSAFSGQVASLVGREGSAYSLSGLPVFDVDGRLSGYRIQAVPEMQSEQHPHPDPAKVVQPAEAATPSSFAGEGIGSDIGAMLRAPLDRIIVDAELMRDRAGGALRQGYADYAVDIALAARHLLSLVDDLVEVQAIEHPDFRAEAVPFEMGVVARRVATLLGGRADERGIRVEVDSASPLPVLAEERRVIQILVNLVGNALRYAPRGSCVRIVGEGKGGMMLLAVEDEGPGIAAADRVRIFEKFERLDRSDPGGSGLGLYISRRLARAMGGDISIEDSGAGGARFVLALPRAVDQRLSTGT